MRVLGLTLIFLFSAIQGNNAQAGVHNFEEVSPGVYRGGFDGPYHDRDFEFLIKKGIRTIVNLRQYNEPEVILEGRGARGHGLNYRHDPIGVFSPNDEHVQQALADLGDPELQPVFVHCRRGHDRTNLIVGLYRVTHDHVSPERATEEMEAHHFGGFFSHLGLVKYFTQAISGLNGDE